FLSVVVKSMIGLIAPDRFEQELIAALAVSPANADKIIAVLNAQVFEPIHDYVLRGKPSTDTLAKTGIVIESAAPEEVHTVTESLAAYSAGTREIDLGTTMEPKPAVPAAPPTPTLAMLGSISEGNGNRAPSSITTTE